jgi:anthranilate synthase, component I (EC 4.1.3.27)
MDFCIALRTAVLKDGVMYTQAGGGVVYDSDPEAEWQESVNKAKALRAAAEGAGMSRAGTAEVFALGPLGRPRRGPAPAPPLKGVFHPLEKPPRIFPEQR